VTKFALDTNVFVHAQRVPGALRPFADFTREHGSRTFLNAVVIQELRTGARTPDQITDLHEHIVAPFERRQRVITPSAASYWECGRVLVDLITHERLDYADTSRSLVNDVLLAVSCRAHGITLVTRDTDFERIARYVKGFTHAAPFPS
jgi:predicted nucleic acid-binding protein